MAAAPSHCEGALMCSVPKESLESTAKAIRVRLHLYLGKDVGSDYLSLGERQVRLSAPMTSCLFVECARTSCDECDHALHVLFYYATLRCAALRIFMIRQGVHLEQRYNVVRTGSIVRDAGAVSPAASVRV